MMAGVRAADRAWAASTSLAKQRVAPRQRHVVWRWCVSAHWCWREVALQPEPAWWDHRVGVSHFVLGWVSGRWRGRQPWWERVCRKHLTIPVADGEQAGAVGRRLVLWQAPTQVTSGFPTSVSHATCAAHQGLNTSSGVVWAVFSDTIRRGQCPEAPRGFATVFDMQLRDVVVADMGREEVRKALAECDPPKPFREESLPYALYHGTGGDMAWLRRRGARLRDSPCGMLGVGVYLGSFTKAVRFAAFARNAVPVTEFGARGAQDAVGILRVLVFAASAKVKRMGGGRHPMVPAARVVPHGGGKRKRGGAAGRQQRELAKDWTDRQRAPFVDHESTWRRQHFDAVALLPTRVGVNPHTGQEVWVVRNEEWCVRSSLTLIRNVADLHLGTVTLDPWRPWRRAAAIH